MHPPDDENHDPADPAPPDDDAPRAPAEDSSAAAKEAADASPETTGDRPEEALETLDAEQSELDADENAEDDDSPLLEKVWDADKDVPEEVLLSRLESLIFVSQDPITVRKLAKILALDGRRVRKLLGVLTERYKNRGIVLQEISGGFQFRTHPDNAAIIREVFKLRPLRLSRAALETLSIVAYRQPLTRAEAEDIRGVDCGGVLKFLFEKGLVRVIGRKEEPGRPIIYGTSQTFLELFGLKSLSDLPPLHEFSELWDDHKKMVDEQAPLEEALPKQEVLPTEGSASEQRAQQEEAPAEGSPSERRDGEQETSSVEGDEPERPAASNLEEIARRFSAENEPPPEDEPASGNVDPAEDELDQDEEKDEP